MRVQLSVVAIAISSALGLGSAWGQNQQPAAASQTAQKAPQWKDRAEYDLVQSALAEKDAQKKLDLLHQWLPWPRGHRQFALLFALLTAGAIVDTI